MILNMPGHIEMIRNREKTQTRRVNRGIYQVGRDYAVQSRRGDKAVEGIRIVIDKIGVEGNGMLCDAISKEDAIAEGFRSPTEFEETFHNLHARRNWKGRWVFKFHVIEVKK